MPPAIVPSNPGWYSGYVPSAEEWAIEWSNKVDFPAPINQGGTGAQTVPLANGNLQQRLLVPGGAPYYLSVLTWYGLRTATAPVEVYLPLLSSVRDGDWIEMVDVDQNAATHNIQVFCQGPDQLQLWSVEGTTALFNISGTRAVAIACSTFWSISVW